MPLINIALLLYSEVPNKWGGLNNRVGWKFPGCLIIGRVLIKGRDGKPKNYVFIVNVKK